MLFKFKSKKGVCNLFRRFRSSVVEYILLLLFKDAILVVLSFLRFHSL